MESSIPVNCLWGSAPSCHVVPIHFRPPIGGPVLSLPFTFGFNLQPGFESLHMYMLGPGLLVEKIKGSTFLVS